MQQRQVNKPLSVNLDKSKKYLKDTEAFYMLNRDRNINGTGTLGKTTPLIANYQACDIEQPAGNNYGNHKYYSELTNELYWWTYNSNGVNFIARLNGDGTCQIVYDGDCLFLSAAPAHSIEQWRCYMKYDKYCTHQHGKQLIWTDGINEIGQIDVEASIATNSFTTAFFDICTNDCAAVEMCVPEMCGRLEGEFVTLAAEDVDLTNHIVDVGIKVAVFQIYYDQRETVMSDVSTLFFQDSKGCFDTSEGFPRCIKFTVPLGNPLVDKYEIVFSTDNGVTWKSSDIVEKYKPYSNSAQFWYERELADLPDLDLENCTFSYYFCNDKQCNPVDPKRASRVFNPMPRKAQGMLPIAHDGITSLGFYNYLKGTCPVDGEQTDKFTISLNCPADTCVEKFATVTVYAIVHNRETNRNGFVYRLLGNSTTAPDDLTDIARFGAALPGDGYGQYFKDKTRNFIAYVEGTNYWAQMVQYHAAPGFISTSKTDILSGMGTPTIAMPVFQDIGNGNYYYQQYQLKVPKGTKGFIRITNQSKTDGLPDNGQDTSTFVVGTITDIVNYYGTIDIDSSLSSYSEELYFDTCSGDVTISETLIIDDNHVGFEDGAHSSSAYCGYLTDANNKSVEGAEIWYDGVIRAITDFNGFYHFYLFGDENVQTIAVQVRVETDCGAGFHDVKTVTLSGAYNTIVQTDIKITDADDPGYKTNFYEIVNITLKDCHNAAVAGIRVALSGSKYQVTDVAGVATFHCRNYSTRTRSVRGVVMDVNNCFTQDCSNNCNPCIPSTNNTALSACFSGTPYVYIATTTNLNKDSAFTNKKGLKAGGRYGWSIAFKGSCGHISAAYPITVLNGSLPTGDNYMAIPKTQAKGVLSFCDFNYNGTGMVVPDYFNCAMIMRTVNLNNYELQWVVDKIERTNDGKIKLTIQSLNDYNATYDFKTNTIYQYFKGDRVEFINNGDAVIFDTATYGLLNYQILSPFHDRVISGQTTDTETADFFNQILIDDDGKLDTLTVGAKIELQRPVECTVKPTYYVVDVLPLITISGQTRLANPTGTFSTFDTFLVNRQVFNQVGISNPPQQFEHKFPSDFWGSANADGIFTGLSDIGKAHFGNKFENEYRAGRNLTINSATKFNYFGDIEKTFDAPEQGDITAMAIYDSKVGVAIGEFDNFNFQVSNEFVRVQGGGNNLILAAPADAIISDGAPKVVGRYGCGYDDIGSVYFGDGFITWICSKIGGYIKNDFNQAVDISEGRYKLWIKKKVQFMANFNKTATDVNKYRYSTGQNAHTKAVQLTFKALNQGATFNEIEPFISTNETLLIDAQDSLDLLTLAGYTPEGYSYIKLNDANGCCFVIFYNGKPFVHPVIPIKYNEFCGIACDSVVTPVINDLKEKVVIPISMQVQDEIMWFVKKVQVDKPSFDSEIPPIRMKKIEDKWNASFLFNKNARGGIYGTDTNIAGEPPRGYFCAVTMVRDNTNVLIYNSTNDAKRIIFDELDLVIFKVAISEESGMDENR